MALHVNGLDTSDWQGSVDWKQVHDAGYSFAYTKATQGIGNVQDTFAANSSGIDAAGMLFGAYHMFQFDQDPEAQAKHFLSVYAPKSGDLPPMLDLELATNTTASDAVARIATWLHAVEAVTKKHCLLYMGFYFWQDSLGSTTGFSGHPLFLAQYTDAETPSVPSAWPTLTMWQYSQSGVIPGIAGNVDLDRFIGDTYALRAMALEL